jgi:hypothetical protein
MLGVATLLWLAATLWGVHASIDEQSGIDALGVAALSLPQVVLAGAVAGCGVALALLLYLGPARPWLRLALGAGTGLGAGAVVVALALLTYGAASTTALLAATVAVATLLGGALAALRPSAAVLAGLTGIFVWFVVGFLQAAFFDRLAGLLGGVGPASARLAVAVPLLGGILVGLTAHASLRRRTDLRWPAYLLAGALPGLLIIAAGALAQLGGAPLLRLVAGLSRDDDIVHAFIGEQQLKTALLVLFAGAVTALLLFGRTLRPPAD